jgi:uncharacterized protein (TIGR02391 family)
MKYRELLEVAPDADRLLNFTENELQRILLAQVKSITDDELRRMAAHEEIVDAMYFSGQYTANKRPDVARAVRRAWEALENAELIEEPDSLNGKFGKRRISEKGRKINTAVDLSAAKVRSWLTPDLLNPKLHKACLNAFKNGDYDTAVFEALKTVEVEVRKKGGYGEGDYGVPLMDKAFEPNKGPLTDMSLPLPRRNARQRLFMGAMGDLRNPKGHSDPTINDPREAIELIMTAGCLLRIIGV